MCISSFDKSSPFYQEHTPIEYFWHYLSSVILIIIFVGLITSGTLTIFWTYKLITHKGDEKGKIQLKRKFRRSMIFLLLAVITFLLIPIMVRIIGLDTLCI